MFFSLQELRRVQKMEKMTLEEIFQLILTEYEKYGIEKNLLEKAFELGKKTHAHQMRESGSLYFSHPLIAAWLMMPMKPDAKILVATFLHDAIEDSQTPEETAKEIKKNFGEEIHHLIDGVSKVGNVTSNPEKDKSETLKKIFEYSAEDVRILIIKLFDRLHNILTIAKKKDPLKRAAKAKETLEIFLPAANKLGIWELKKNLEDACIMHLSPNVFEQIADQLEMQSRIARDLYSTIETQIEKNHAENTSENVALQYVPYSFSTLMQRHHIGKNVLPEFLFFVEITVENEKKCYEMLSELTRKYPQKEEFLQDYIQNPKENWYRGIHTTLVVNNAHLVRFHILSTEMTNRNTYGVFLDIAQENFRLPLFEKDLVLDQNLSSDEFVELLQHDVLLPKICIHHPQKGQKYLPNISTALDAAIRFFPEDFPFLEQISVNNETKSLETPLKQNDIVSFQFDLKKNLSLDWITKVNSSYGKFHIQKILKEEREEEKERIGEHKIQMVFDAVRMGTAEDLLEMHPEVLQHFHAQNTAEIYRFVAEGLLMPEEILEWMAQKTEKKISLRHKFFPSFFANKNFSEEKKTTLLATSKNLSLADFSCLIGSLCTEHKMQEEKMLFSKKSTGIQAKVIFTHQTKKKLFHFFSALRNSPSISDVSFLPPFSFFLKIFFFLSIPFLVGSGILALLLSQFGETHAFFASSSIILFTLANTWSFHLLSRYFFVLKNNIPVLLSLFGINALAITAWIYLSFHLFFAQSSYSTFSLLIALVFVLAFFIPFMSISKKKSAFLPPEQTMNAEEWQKRKKEKMVGYAMRIGAVLCFGANPIFAKYFFPEDTNKIFVMSLSLGFAALCLIPFFLIALSKKQIQIKESYNHLLATVLVSAVFFFIFYYLSIQFTTASNPALILNLAPVLGLIIGIFFLADKTKYLHEKKDILMMFLIFAIGIAGTFLLILDKGNIATENFPQKILGDSLGVIAMIFDVIYTIALIHYAKSQNALSGMKFTMFQTITLGLVFLPVSIYYFLHFPPLDMRGMLGIFMIGIFGSILGYYLAYESYKRLDGFINYLLMNLFPLITVVLEVFFFDLPLSYYLILGGFLIIGSSIGAEVLNTHCEKRKLKTKVENFPKC